MTIPHEALDEGELIQLAIHSRGDLAAAIALLKIAAARPNASAAAHFLLGSFYARAEMFQRAVASMEFALERDPSMLIARFQLGLLRLTSGEIQGAAADFGQLRDLDETQALGWFSRGLLHLIGERYDEMDHCIRRGIALNATNPPLNTDMERVLSEVELIRQQAPARPLQ
jgi:tetratricopeptide (TPR) repeat protein